MAKREISLLSKGLFNKSFMDSKVTTKSVTKKELVLGHLVGPLGLVFVVNTIAALVEKFFTQQTGAMYGVNNVAMIQQMGGTYEIIMTVAKILAVGMGLLNSWLISKTHTRHGRLRPWYLIFGFVTIAIGFLIFLFPGNTLGSSYWFYFFTLLICYHTIGSSYFYLFRDSIVSLVTRDPSEKTRLAFVRKLSWTLISGIIIGMIINSVVLPMWLEHDINGYAVLMIGLSVVAIPLLLMEYFYTKERVIDDVALENGLENENKIPLRSQIKALLTNKYFVILFVLMTIGGIVDNFKGGNVQYFYIKYLLGGNENWGMFSIYQIITGTPVGIGAIIAYPIAKKVGIKNMTVAGYALVLVGSIMGILAPANVPIAMVAGLFRNIGMIPNSYIFITLLFFAYDSIEYKSGFRLEGLLGIAILFALQTAIYAPFAGGYESAILKLGFVDVEGVLPAAGVTSFMTLAFYLFDIILAAAYLILLPLVDVEKKMPMINQELQRRKKDAVIASGGTWIEPEEQERMEKEAAELEREENRIADLKAHCTHKHLDFDTENAKYIASQEEKRRKQEAKAEKKKLRKA
ncbi:MAG: MFS transporter [Eubacteriales bacterium]|nr:MFS transporter [Eubacteriales bacterium]MDD3880683.1 MFS transporter [Eubacteriales bacterium]MDD4511683.1 MFS transporter [Eubacteriales bacterium]